jgi:hypothetical protein
VSSTDILECARHAHEHRMVITLLFSCFFMLLALVVMLNPIGEP